MALGPKQMGEAVIRNLKSKTGKDVAEWIKILRQSKLVDKKEAIKFLKSEHALGHFQSQAVFEAMTNSNVYDHSESFIPNLFSNPELRKLYDHIAGKIQKLGKDVRIQPCKTYIPFYRNNQFAIIKPYKKDKVLLALNMPDDFEHPRFEKGKTGASIRINFKSILESKKDLDSEIMNVLKTAYQNN